MLYLFTGNFEQARNVAHHHNYTRKEFVFVDQPVELYMRGKGRQDIYFCAAWYERPDVPRAERVAKHLGWNIIKGLPPQNDQPQERDHAQAFDI